VARCSRSSGIAKHHAKPHGESHVIDPSVDPVKPTRRSLPSPTLPIGTHETVTLTQPITFRRLPQQLLQHDKHTYKDHAHGNGDFDNDIHRVPKLRHHLQPARVRVQQSRRAPGASQAAHGKGYVCRCVTSRRQRPPCPGTI
jgi:hypothetical protein